MVDPVLFFPSERQKALSWTSVSISYLFTPTVSFPFFQKPLSHCFHALTGNCHPKFENSGRKGGRWCACRGAGVLCVVLCLCESACNTKTEQTKPWYQPRGGEPEKWKLPWQHAPGWMHVCVCAHEILKCISAALSSMHSVCLCSSRCILCVCARVQYKFACVFSCLCWLEIWSDQWVTGLTNAKQRYIEGYHHVSRKEGWRQTVETMKVMEWNNSWVFVSHALLTSLSVRTITASSSFWFGKLGCAFAYSNFFFFRLSFHLFSALLICSNLW